MEEGDRNLIIQFLKTYYEELAGEDDEVFKILTLNDILKNIIRYPSRILIFKKALLGGVTWGDFEDFDEDDFEEEDTTFDNEMEIKIQDINRETFHESFTTILSLLQVQIEDLGISSKLPYFIDTNFTFAFSIYPEMLFSDFRDFVMGQGNPAFYQELYSSEEYEELKEETTLLSFILKDVCTIYDEMYSDMTVYIRREG